MWNISSLLAVVTWSKTFWGQDPFFKTLIQGVSVEYLHRPYTTCQPKIRPNIGVFFTKINGFVSLYPSLISAWTHSQPSVSHSLCLLLSFCLFGQVWDGMGDVPFLCCWLRNGLEGRLWAMYLFRGVSCFGWPAEAAMVDLYCTLCAWLILWRLLWIGRHLCWTNGMGELAKALAKIRSKFCILRPHA